MQAATALAQQYDANYAARNPSGLAALYAADGRHAASKPLTRRLVIQFFAGHTVASARGLKYFLVGYSRAPTHLDDIRQIA
jgi:hypothetical protein